MTDPLDHRCGTCARFVRVMDAVGPTGQMRREGECLLGVWPKPLFETSTCSQWVRKGEARTRAPEPRPRQRSRQAPRAAIRPRAPDVDRPKLPLTLPEDLLDMDEESFRRVLSEVIRDELGVGDANIAGKWDGGTVILKPGKEGLQEKSIPIETLFSKVVMIRDRLRVLEQKINGHPKLASDEKVQMQQYVTACYGSLTTFNVLFADREDQFVGQKGDE
jgi:hypothetical protein